MDIKGAYKIAADREKVRRFAERSRAAADDWTPERGVDRWHDMFRTVLRRERPATTR